MSNWIDAITSPLKAAGESIKGLVEIRDQVKFGEEVTKIYSQILAALQGAVAAQTREAALLNEISDLKRRLVELDAWETEKNRYVLEKLPPGVFVYTLKPEMAGSDPEHHICQTCYQRGKKSILHSGESGNGIYRLTCTECGTKLQVGHFTPSGRSTIHRGTSGGPFAWMGS
jgi:hypothetical protein